MSVKVWIATHSGLPSIYSDEDVTVKVSDGRILRAAGQGAPFYISDALALPGVELTYTVGSTPHALTRKAKNPGLGIIAALDGRGIDGIYQINNQDTTQWDSDVSRYSTGINRWPLNSPNESGESILTFFDPKAEEKLMQILKAKAPIIIGPALPTPGVPMRVVTVTSIERRRHLNARITLTLSWTAIDANQISGAAPLITWGEWASQKKGWQNRTFNQLAKQIAGMP